MKIELKYIAPYLPYGLKMYAGKLENTDLIYPVLSAKEGSIFTYCNGENNNDGAFFMDIENYNLRPMLRPMTNLENYFMDYFDDDIDVRTFMSDEFLESKGIETFDEIYEFKIEWLPFGVVSLLIKHHFDIFDLIAQGLAIDENSLSLMS